jgi:hypothetical protein
MSIRFPTMAATSLDGRTVRLPDDLEQISVVILAFQRWQQREVDEWIEELVARGCVHPMFEVPTIGRRYRLARSFIDGGMRAGIPDPVVRARTLTTYTSVSRVLGVLELSSTSHVVVTLVGPDGEVSAMVQGAFDSADADAFVSPPG